MINRKTEPIRSTLHLAIKSMIDKSFQLPYSLSSLDLYFPANTCAANSTKHLRSKKYLLGPFTYRSLSQRFAAGLRSLHGFQSGDRVFLASANSVYTAVVFRGKVMAGGIFVGAQHSFDLNDLRQQIYQTEPKVLLMTEAFQEIVLQAIANEHDGPVYHGDCYLFEEKFGRRCGDDTRVTRHWEQLLRAGELAGGDSLIWSDFHTSSEAQQTASLIYSSGTSGQPKGVELTHYQIIASVIQNGTSMVQTQGSPPLGYMWMAQVVGQVHACVSIPKIRLPVYIAPRFDFVSVADNVIDLAITSVVIHPGFMIALMKEKHMHYRVPKMRSLN